MLQRPVDGPTGTQQDLRSFKLIMEYIKALPVSALYFSTSLFHKSIASIGSGLIMVSYRKNVVSIPSLLVIIYEGMLMTFLGAQTWGC